MRYVAFVTQDGFEWQAVLPDFPDIVVYGRLLPQVLGCARRALIDRSAALHYLGAAMPAPRGAAAVVGSPRYSVSMLAIVAIPDPPPEGSAFRFGGL